MNIVLTGFMGTGKTAVGKELARRLGMRYLDTDEIIEERENCSIPEIFAHFGEGYFRKVESEVVKEVGRLDGYVISTGGGVVLSRENIKALRKRGYIVCLKANPEVILRRTEQADGERPLLKGWANQKKRIQDLLKKRDPFYNQADVIIDTSFLPVAEVVDRLVRSLPPGKLQVKLGKRSYPIFIGSPVDEVGGVAKDFKLGKKILIVSDSNVFPVYGERVRDSLKEQLFEVSLVQIPPGEKSKSLTQAKKIYNFCLDFALDRTSSILALGGGVVGDLAGFVAATFLRGINFLMVPTTLLSQVDSGVGGKVGVNLPQGKNLVGAFYQPKFVLIDPLVLKTLSSRRMREGMAEVIKCAIIKNGDFFCYLEENILKALNQDGQILRFIIEKAVTIKIGVVQEDEKEEKGIRQILNFGHTIGHAIEAVSRYGRYTHGEAVAMGMMGEAKLAREMGFFSLHSLMRVKKLLMRAKLPTKGERLDPDRIFQAMMVDKKVREGKLWFVLPQKIGQVGLVNVPKGLVKKVVEELVV